MKNKTIVFGGLFVLATLVCMFSFVQMRKSFAPYTHFIGVPLPEGTSLDRSHCKTSGIDASASFRFSCDDDNFLNVLIEKWKLAPVGLGEKMTIGSEPAGCWWWPEEGELEESSNRYEHVDDDKEEFMAVWKDGNQLFVRCGSW